MKKNIFGLFIVGVLFSASSQAQYKFESLNPGCPLKKFVGGKWENASASELADKSLPAPKTLAGSTTAAGIKFNNTWYSAPSQCFANGAASLPEAGNEAAPTPAPEVLENAAPKKSRNSSTQRSSNSNELPSFYFRLEGGFMMDQSANSKAHTDSSSGLAVNYAAATHPVSLGGAIGHNFSDTFALELRVSKNGLKQASTATGIGTIVEDVSLLDIHLAPYFHITRGPFSPFIGANVGYSSYSNGMTLSDFNLIPTYNGVVKSTASTVGFGAVLGCDIQIAGGLAAVPMISYKAASFKPKVSTSTSDVAAAGEQGADASIKFFLFTLGLQYSF